MFSRSSICRALCALCLVSAFLYPRASAQNPFLERKHDRHIGKIQFVGAKVTKQYILERGLGLARGDLYSWAAVTDARERLESLSFIEYVVIEEDFHDADTVDLLVTVNEDDRLIWAPHAAYERRHDHYVVGLDFAMRNLRGRHETLGVRSSWWGKHGYQAHWDNPRILDPASLSLRADISWESYKFRFEPFDFRDLFFEFGVGRQLGPWLKAEVAGQLREVVLEDGGTAFPDAIQRDDAVLLWLEHDSRDLRFYPSKGIHAWAAARFGRLGEERSYEVYRLHLAAFWNIPYVDILAARVEQRLSGSPLPVYERSFLGGPQDLRGIDFGSIEGDQHFLASFEIRRPIFLMKLLEGRALGVGVHAFHDWGKAYEHGAGFDSAAIVRSWGAGIHFNFNTRNLRLEWARNEDGDDSVLFEDNFSF
ncbi:MAG TPA: BamA/TamA family outer membrane protein [Candidatus Krumholzibacteria bacterium]